MRATGNPFQFDWQSKLLEMQLERDEFQDSRRKELQSREDLQTQLKNITGELEAASEQQDEVLREAGSQNEHLTKVDHGLEELLLELRGILMDCKDSAGRKLCEPGDIISLSTAFCGGLRDLDSQVSHLKGKLVLVEEELQSLTKGSQAQREFLLQQHQMREQARTPDLVRPHQVCHLESTVCQLRSQLGEVKRICENKVKDLEKQLHLAHSETAEAQTDEAQRGQESGNLNYQIHQLLTELH
ncbi:coiled-coil domain-containing protein 158 [Chamaea fasciata]|uniref:coiled-coil domain-containing protein 158 n=1 Tax=Chamaea fasciata TaxID=190680 RepID=UPI00336AD9D3